MLASACRQERVQWKEGRLEQLAWSQGEGLSLLMEDQGQLLAFRDAEETLQTVLSQAYRGLLQTQALRT